MQFNIQRLLFPSPAKWYYWLPAAFLFKALLFIFKITAQPHIPSGIDGFWGGVGGDTESYLLPVENLISTGSYLPDYRMPGYGIVYLPLIFLFSKATAYNILILLQLALSSLSVYLLALTSRNLFNKVQPFYIVFYLYAISSFTSLFDSLLLSESLATSFLIIAVYFFFLYFRGFSTPGPGLTGRAGARGHAKKDIFFSGLFLTWVVFLRPVFAPFILIFALCLLIERRKALTTVIIFCLPFMVCDGYWTIRNYTLHSKFIPLSHKFETYQWEELWITAVENFVESWGGNYINWDPNAEIRWFGINKELGPGQITGNEKKVELPDFIYTSKFNKDSLLAMRKEIILLSSDTLSQIKKELLQQDIINKSNIYSLSIKQEKPALYYLKAPLLYLRKFLIQSGTYNLFNKPADKLNALEYGIKIFYSILYLTVLGGGICGILMMAKQIFSNESHPENAFFLSIIPAIPLYTILIHPLFFRLCESRYLVPAYPFLLLCAVYAVMNVFRRLHAYSHKFLLV